MDDLYDLLNMFKHWRMLLVTAIGVVLAITLANVVTPFPAAAWVGVLCAGVVLGVLWDRRSR